MAINNIQSTYSFLFAPPQIDSEEKEIMRRLIAYGMTPTGNKSADRAKLHSIEIQKAKQETTVSATKFLSVSTVEQGKIQENKKQKRKETKSGADILSDYNKAFINKK